MYIGHTMQEMVHPDDYAIIQGIIQENASKRHYEGIFARLRTASSNWQWTKTSAILVKDVKNDQLICYTYDINDLVDAREDSGRRRNTIPFTFLRARSMSPGNWILSETRC